MFLNPAYFHFKNHWSTKWKMEKRKQRELLIVIPTEGKSVVFFVSFSRQERQLLYLPHVQKFCHLVWTAHGSLKSKFHVSKETFLILKNLATKRKLKTGENIVKQGGKSNKVAFLTSKPNDVVLTTLYSRMVTKFGLNFSMNIFSTVEAVVRLFGEDIISEKEFAEIIYEFKTKPDNVYLKLAW